MTGTTQDLARFIATLERGAIPQAVRHQAARCLVNWAGCATGSGRHPAVGIALAALRPFIGPAQAGVLGTDVRVDALHAALLNGIRSCSSSPASRSRGRVWKGSSACAMPRRQR